jgi:hypothetical protein
VPAHRPEPEYFGIGIILAEFLTCRFRVRPPSFLRVVYGDDRKPPHFTSKEVGTTGDDTARCAFCGWRLRVEHGRLPRHLVHDRGCLGSGQAVGPEAFGRIRARIPMGGTTCIACGQHVDVMTVHDGVHAVWPCGDSFVAVPPDAEPAVLPAPREAWQAPAGRPETARQDSGSLPPVHS